ncbi:MAG: hypothetical protein ACYCS1_10205 [Gammaproteobacteria bacterium]
MIKRSLSGPSLLQSPPWDRIPLSLLIALYEENYQLCQNHLGPSKNWLPVRHFTGRGPLPLIVRLMGRSTYTSTFEIGFASSRIQPTFVARLYDDLKVCEVLAFAECGRPWKMPFGSDLDLESRWSRNMAFQKWIHYAF